MQEERKPKTPDPFLHVGVQAGAFSDEEEAKLAKNLNLEFRMVIDDWAKTPVYDMIMKGWS